MEPNHSNKLLDFLSKPKYQRKDYLKKIIAKETMSEEELAIVRGLFEHFYETESINDKKYAVYEKKENTNEYRYTFKSIKHTQHNSKCIYVIDTTGKDPKQPCSKDWLLEFRDKTNSISKKLRQVIRDQIDQFRYENQSKMQPGIEYEVDHSGEYTFDDIVKLFIQENGGEKNLEMTYSENQKEDGGYTLTNKSNIILNQKFKNFHKNLAKLDLKTKEEHALKTKQDQQKRSKNQ